MPTNRPADADIPSAVRAAFATNRLKGAWNMASEAQPGDRSAGIEAACRLLEKEGLTLADVMTAILSIKEAPSSQARTMAEAFSGFEGIFTPKPAAQAEPVRRRREHLSGSEIPGSVCGSISIDDERPTKNGRMVVFTVSHSDCVYGPLVCFTNSGIETLKAAAEEDVFLAMTVRQPNAINQMPSVSSVRRA